MNKRNRPVSTISLTCAFLMGLILFLAVGQNWLDLESMSVFLAGLIGVALVVLAFGIVNIQHNSRHEE